MLHGAEEVLKHGMSDDVTGRRNQRTKIGDWLILPSPPLFALVCGFARDEGTGNKEVSLQESE